MTRGEPGHLPAECQMVLRVTRNFLNRDNEETEHRSKSLFTTVPSTGQSSMVSQADFCGIVDNRCVTNGRSISRYVCYYTSRSPFFPHHAHRYALGRATTVDYFLTVIKRFRNKTFPPPGTSAWRLMWPLGFCSPSAFQAGWPRQA